MRQLIATFLITLFSLSGAQAAPELKGQPEELRRFLHPHPLTVSLQGTAKETTYADVAKVEVSVTTEAKTLEAALTENRTLRGQIANALIAAGLDREAIKTAKFATSPQYGWFGKKPSSFEVVNRMTITLDDENLMQKLAGLVDQYDEVSLGNMDFKHSGEEASKAGVLKKALKNVMAQKMAYEQELGVTLKVRNIHRNAFVNPRPQMMRRATLKMESMAAMPEDAAYESAPQTGFGELEYHSQVNVEFEIVQP